MKIKKTAQVIEVVKNVIGIELYQKLDEQYPTSQKRSFSVPVEVLNFNYSNRLLQIIGVAKFIELWEATKEFHINLKPKSSKSYNFFYIPLLINNNLNRRKYREEDLPQIKELLQAGKSQKQIGMEFGLSRSTMQSIIKRHFVIDRKLKVISKEPETIPFNFIEENEEEKIVEPIADKQIFDLAIKTASEPITPKLEDLPQEFVNLLDKAIKSKKQAKSTTKAQTNISKFRREPKKDTTEIKKPIEYQGHYHKALCDKYGDVEGTKKYNLYKKSVR